MIPDRYLRRVLGTDRRVALFGDLIRGIAVAVVVLLIAFLVAYHAAVTRFMYSQLHMNDFGKFYYSARLFLDGADMYATNPATKIPVAAGETRQFLNMNPPHFHLVMLPLALLAPAPALGVWLGINLLALALSIGIVTRELRWRWTATRALWALLGALACSATGAVVVTGQLSFLLMLGMTLAWRDARHGAWTRAGLWLGLLAGVKPFLGVFLVYLLARKRVLAAVVMAGTVATSFAAGLAVFGVAAHRSWLGALSSASWTWPSMNGSIAGFFGRTLTASPAFVPLIVAPGLARFATIAVITAAVLATVLALRQHASDTDRGFVLVLLLALLVTPIGWVYYLWVAFGPLAGLLCAPRRWTRFDAATLSLAVPGLLCPLALTGPWRDAPIAAVTLGSAYFWATLALWLTAVVLTPPSGPAEREEQSHPPSDGR